MYYKWDTGNLAIRSFSNDNYLSSEYRNYVYIIYILCNFEEKNYLLCICLILYQVILLVVIRVNILPLCGHTVVDLNLK